MAIRLIYNSINIDLKINDKALDIKYHREKNVNRPGKGLPETINFESWREIFFSGVWADGSNHYDLLAWWSWAEQGKEFAFAYDSTKTADTTLDGSAAAGQAVVPLTATTGLTIDDICLIESVDSREIVEIDSISVGVSITAKANLKFGYASGDIFRHYKYFPEVVTQEKVFNPDLSGGWYSYLFKFVEVLDL